MSNPIDSFLKQLDEHVEATEGAKMTLAADYVGAMETIGSSVEGWLADHNMIEHSDATGADICTPCASFKADQIGQTLDAAAIVDLCKKCHVSPEHLKPAARRVAALLARTVGCTASKSFGQYGAKSQTDKTLLSVESLYGQDLMGKLTQTASLETFGINLDRVEPDLKSILTIALLQFHTNLTPRIVPIQTVTQSNVTIVREAMEVFDLSADNAMKPTRVIELYKDPSMVTVKAMRIEPLKVNDTANTALVANGIYKFMQTVNMFELAKIAGKDGWDKFNHTDLVEDNIILDGVLAKVVYTKDTATGPKNFYTMLRIPDSKGRYTQQSNDLRSTDRRLNLDRFPIALTSNTAKDTKSGLVSEIDSLAELKNGAYLVLDLHVNGAVDRRTAMMNASGWLGKAVVKGGSFGDGTSAAAVAEAAKYVVTLEGFTLDARYNEDNKRKTSIRAEMVRRSMSWELPTGRNFVIDSAIGQDGVVNAAARLAQLEHIGRDYNNLTIITTTLDQVHDQNVSLTNDREAEASLASQYAAGDLVNPYVYEDTMDMSAMYGMRSADASGDTKQFVKSYFNRLTSELLLKTYFAQQLAEGAAVVFRVITSPTILGELFKVKHIHQHLETDAEGTGGVEHVVALDNGVRLEFVTSTFESVKNKIILIPFLANSQSSVLNFGTDFDQGTLVGAISMASDGGPAYHRLFSVTRELLIPTNVMGAIITVAGGAAVASVNNMGADDTDANLTVLGFDNN